MPQNIYQALWIFIIYAFLGWCSEVAFAAVNKGKFVNRGFLNGPVCPIYGVGMLIVVLCLWSLRDRPLLLFLGSALLTTALEFVTGFVLERVFHDKWWDYSDMPFNIKGYVCLKFTILWGLAASFIIGAIHRFIYMLIEKTPFVLGVILLAVFSAAFIADFIVTLTALVKLPKKLKAMAEAERALRAVSDKIGENISDTTIAAKEKGEALAEENKPRLEELKAEYEKKKKELSAMLERNFVQRRIFKAFPNLKNGRYKAIFDRISELKLKVTEKGNETACESCANYVYDPESDIMYCDMELDEDEMQRFLTSQTYNCPYYDFYDEYKIVRKQN